MQSRLRKKTNNKVIAILIAILSAFFLTVLIFQSFAWFKDEDEEVNTHQIGRIELSENVSSQNNLSIPISLSRQTVLENDIIFTPTENSSAFYTRFQVYYPQTLNTSTVAREVMKYYSFSPYTTNIPEETNFGLSWIRFGDFYYLCNSSGVPVSLSGDDYKANNEDCYIFLKNDSIVVSPRMKQELFNADEELLLNINVETVQARNICTSEYDGSGNLLAGEDGDVDSISDIAWAFSTQYPTDTYSVTYKDTAGETSSTVSNISYGGSATYIDAPVIPTNYSFVEWNTQADGSGAKITANSLTNITENITLYPIVAPVQVEIHVSYGNYGEILPNSGNNQNYLIEYNSSQTFEVKPNMGYKINTVTINSVPQTLELHDGESFFYTFNDVTSAQTISATFSTRQFSITLTTIAEGLTTQDNIISSSSTTVLFNTASHETIINPPTGYLISSIKVDEVEINEFTATGDSVVFNNIISDHSIVVIYSKVAYSITYNKDGGDEELGKENPAVYYIISPTFNFNPVLKSNYIFAGWFDNSSFTGNSIKSINMGSMGNRTLYAKFIARDISNTTANYGYQMFPNFNFPTKHNVNFEAITTSNGPAIKLNLTGSDPYFTPTMPADFNATGTISQVRVLLDKNSAPINEFEVWTTNPESASEIFGTLAQVENNSDTWVDIDIDQENTFNLYKPSDATSGYFLIKSIEFVTELSRSNNGKISLIAKTTSELPSDFNYTFIWKKDSEVIETTNNAINFKTINESGTYSCDITITDSNGNNVIAPYTIFYTASIDKNLPNTMENLTTTYTGNPITMSVGDLPFGANVTYSYQGFYANGTSVSGTGNSITEAGTYTFTANIDGGNYWNDKTLTATLTINKASFTTLTDSVMVLPGDVFVNPLSSSAIITGLTYSSDSPSVEVNATNGQVTITTYNNIDRSICNITIDGGNNFNSNTYVIEQKPYQFSNATTLSRFLGNDTLVIIPETINGLNTISDGNITLDTATREYTVNTISGGAFENITNITELRLPETLLSVQEAAILSLYSLKKIVLQSDLSSQYLLSSIRSGVWFKDGRETSFMQNHGTYNNTGVIEGISDDWQYSLINPSASVGDADYNLYKITAYLGSDANLKIPNRIFNSSTGVYDIITEVQAIKDSSKSSITSVIFSEGITAIYDNALADFTGLTKAILPSTISSIGNRAFYGCTSLTTSFNLITCPNIVSIGSEAFRYCGYGIRGIIDLTENNSLTTLGDYCFGNALDLYSITLPNSITTMGNNIFVACSKLNSINFESETSSFLSDSNVLFNNGKTRLYSYAAGKTNTAYTIPSSVTWISPYAFWGETNLTDITFAGISVSNVGNGAFNECLSLMTVNVPSANLSAYRTLLSGLDATTSKGFNNNALMWGTGNSNPTYGYLASTYQWIDIESIVISISGNGTITPSGILYVVPGNSYTIAFTPNEGYFISSIVADGVSQTLPADNSATSTYTFSNISNESHTFSVTFSEKVAEVVYQGTYTYFTSLADAITFANGKTDVTLTLLQDVTQTSNLTINSGTVLTYYSAFTINFSGEHCLIVNSGANLIMKSGAINAGTTNAVRNSGQFDFEGGTISSSNSYSTLLNYATFNMGANTTINAGEGTALTQSGNAAHFVSTGGSIVAGSGAYTITANESNSATSSISLDGTSVQGVLNINSGNFSIGGSTSIGGQEGSTGYILLSNSTIIDITSSLTSELNVSVTDASHLRNVVYSDTIDNLFVNSVNCCSLINPLSNSYSLYQSGNYIKMYEKRTVFASVLSSSTNTTNYDNVGGTISPFSTTLIYETNTSVTFSATPNAGYRFVGWYSSTTISDATRLANSVITYNDATNGKTIYAYFKKTQEITIKTNFNTATTPNYRIVYTSTDGTTPSFENFGASKTLVLDYGTAQTINAYITYSSGVYYNLTWGSATNTPVATDTAVGKSTGTITSDAEYTMLISQLYLITFTGETNVTHSAVVTKTIGSFNSTSSSMYAIRTTTSTNIVLSASGSGNYNLVAGLGGTTLTPLTTISPSSTISRIINADINIIYELNEIFVLTFNVTINKHTSTTTPVFSLTYGSTTATSKTSGDIFNVFNSASALSTTLTITNNNGYSFNVASSNSATPAAAASINSSSSCATNGSITGNKTVYYRINEISTITIYKETQDVTDIYMNNVIARYGYAMPTLLLDSPTKLGFTFGGFYSDTNGGGTRYYLANLSSANGWNESGATKSLYGKWTASNYTVTFNPNGGEVSPTTKNVTFNSAYGTLPTPTKTGHSFSGWSMLIEGNNVSISMTTIVSVASNHTLNAIWTANTYTVTFDKQGGNDGTNSIVATYGQPMPNATAPKKLGYIFDGYYLSSKQYYTASGVYNDQAMTSATTCDLVSDTTLEAHWTPKPSTITFDKQGGTGGTNSVVAIYDQTMPNATAPTKTGYVFDGYFTSSSITNLTTSTQSYGLTHRINLSPISSIVAGSQLSLIFTSTQPAPNFDFNDMYDNINSVLLSSSTNAYRYCVKVTVTAEMISARYYDYTSMRFLDLNLNQETTVTNISAYLGGNIYYQGSGEYNNTTMSSAAIFDIDYDTTLYAHWKPKPVTVSYETSMRSIRGWQYPSEDFYRRFSNWNDSDWQLTNCSFTFLGGSGWERVYTSVTLTAGRHYSFTMDYTTPTITAKPVGDVEEGLRVQLLSNVPGNESNYNSELAGIILPSNSTGSASLEYDCPTTGTYYFCYNFGWCDDGVSSAYTISDIKCITRQTHYYNEQLGSLPPSMNLLGYNFNSWGSYTETTILNTYNDKSITANLSGQTFTYTYMSEGTSMGTKTATFGGYVPNGYSPTNIPADCTFMGYYDGTDGTGKQYLLSYNSPCRLVNETTAKTLYAYSPPTSLYEILAARVSNNNISTYYTTLSAAFNACAGKKADIYLLKDVYSETVTMSNPNTDITLYGDDYTIYKNTDGIKLFNISAGSLYLKSDVTLDGQRELNTSKSEISSLIYVTGGTVTSYADIQNNVSLYGGGIYINGGTVTLIGGTITNNNATCGGAVCIDSGTVNFNNGSCLDNTAILGATVYNNGGTVNASGTSGLYIYLTNNASPVNLLSADRIRFNIIGANAEGKLVCVASNASYLENQMGDTARYFFSRGNYGYVSTKPVILYLNGGSGSTPSVTYDASTDYFTISQGSCTNGLKVLYYWSTNSSDNETQQSGIRYDEGHQYTNYTFDNRALLLYAIYLTPSDSSYFIFNAVTGGYSIAFNTATTLSHPVLPKTYNGSNVVSVAPNGFNTTNVYGFVTIPSTITSIGSTAFGWTRHITHVSLPSTLTSIAGSNFVCCSSLQTLYLNNCANYAVYNGCLYTSDYITLLAVPCDLNQALSIRSSTTTCAYLSFADASKFSEIILHENIVNLSPPAFSYNSVKLIYFKTTSFGSIGTSEFSNCNNLQVIVCVDYSAAQQLYSKGTGKSDYIYYPISSSYIPSGTTYSTYSTNCQISSNQMYIKYNNNYYIKYVDPSVYLNISNNILYGFKPGINAADYNNILIPSNVTSIYANAFINNGHLIRIDMSQNDSIVSIGNSAFSGCTNLKVFAYHTTTLTTIDSYAFASTKLTRAVFRSATTSIGSYAFQNCTSLVTIELYGSTAKSFGTGCFSGSGAKLIYGDNTVSSTYSSLSSNWGLASISWALWTTTTINGYASGITASNKRSGESTTVGIYRDSESVSNSLIGYLSRARFRKFLGTTNYYYKEFTTYSGASVYFND